MRPTSTAAASSSGWEDRRTLLLEGQAYPAGCTITEQGAPASEVFHIEQGLLKLVRLDRSGGDAIVGLRSSGCFLGAEAVLLDDSHPVTAITLSPCLLSRMDAGAFRERVRSNLEFSWHLHVAHCRELQDDTVQRADFASLPAKDRLLRVFERLAGDEREGRAVTVRVPLKQWEIARLIGVTPQYVCQLMAQLESEGMLERNGDTYRVAGLMG
jgi:CRP/FNR family cyclic AMP-dependent transcriptional regulator